MPSLREAFAQQRTGEGLLRSEAAHLLIVALAATGQRADAARLLATCPPDELALYPGLRPAAPAATAASAGRPEAVDYAFEAAEQALAAGGTISAVAYLGDAAR
ncbi:MAG: hypothetical protein ACRD0U_02480 [Acidimicrobiales bacterium]